MDPAALLALLADLYAQVSVLQRENAELRQKLENKTQGGSVTNG